MRGSSLLFRWGFIAQPESIAPLHRSFTLAILMLGVTPCLMQLVAEPNAFVMMPTGFLPFEINERSKTELASARTAMAQKDYKTAESLYRHLLLHEPASASLLTDLGISLQYQGRSTEAIHYFQLALKQGPSASTYALLAEERCKTRDLSGARPMLEKMARQTPLDPHVIAAVAPCYLDLNEPLEAVDVYSVLLTDPDYPKDLATIQITRAYLMAAQMFVAKLHEAKDGAPYLAAIQTARDTESSDARGAFAAAAAASPYFPAEASFDQAVKLWRLHPQDTALIYLLSTLSGEESMRYVKICNDTYPNSPYLQEFLAEVLADQGRIDEAVASYEMLLEKTPDLPDLRYKLGMLYNKQQEWQKSIDVFREQLAANPEDERAAARISEAMVELEEYAELEVFLQPRVTAKHPPLWARLDLATAEQKLSKPDLAIAQLVAAERDNPTQKNIHYRLMRLYTATGDTLNAAKEGELFRAAAH